MNISELIKNKLKNKQATIGSWMQLPSTDIAEIMGNSGYDWIAVDLEHGNFSNQSLADINRAIELGGTLPMARIAYISEKDIKDSLEAGAKGLIYPMIKSADQLKQSIQWSLYPPKGSRGVGYSRANLFGRRFEEYCSGDAGEIIKIAQIEHIDAVHNIEEILSVEGLDAVFVGPYDLSASMGLTGQFEHRDFIETMNLITSKAKEYKIPMGLHIVQPDELLLKEKITEGYQFLAYSTDAIFLFQNAKRPQF